MDKEKPKKGGPANNGKGGKNNKHKNMICSPGMGYNGNTFFDGVHQAILFIDHDRDDIQADIADDD